MIIIAGWLRVAAGARQRYLAGCRSIVEQARASEGCLDFALTPDLVDPDRIYVYERWASSDALERFRGDGPHGEPGGQIVDAQVERYLVAAVEPA